MFRTITIGALILLMFSTSLSAQNQKEIEAAKALGIEWLNGLHQIDLADSYEQMSAVARTTITRERWVKVMTDTSLRTGVVIGRTLFGSRYTTRFHPNVPEGEYVLIQYDTVTRKHPNAWELVIVTKENEGDWKVFGYVIGAKPGGKMIHPM